MYTCETCDRFLDNDYHPTQPRPTIFGPDDSEFCCPDCVDMLTEKLEKEMHRYGTN